MLRIGREPTELASRAVFPSVVVTRPGQVKRAPWLLEL